MLIKNFQAGSIQDALQLVRAEFGKDAVIMKTDILKENGRRVFCVTAARDHASAKTLPKYDLKLTFDDVNAQASTVASPAPAGRLESAILDVILPDLLSPDLKRYYFGLRENEVETDLALEICRTLQKANSFSRDDLSKVLNAIISKRGTFPDKEKNIVFVGPCGAGKSSLLAKFATEFVFNRKQVVTLSTLDKFRPGAEQEIDNLSEILDIVEESREEKKSKVKRQLIDTSGLVINDPESLDELSEELRRIPDRFVILVLSASTNWKTNRRFLAQFLPLGIHAIALTQLDLSVSCGTVLNVAAHDYPPIICMSESRLPTGSLINFDANIHLSKLIGEENA